MNSQPTNQPKHTCSKCGEIFKTDVDLQAHLFNNRHCEESECPECLRIVLKEELTSFGGLCEECTSFNE